MKDIVKIVFVFLWTSFSLAQSAAESDSSSNNKLDDVVVQAKYQGSGEEDKLPLALNFDYSKEAVIENSVTWQSLDQFEDDEADTDARGTLALHYAKPQFARIQPAPVKSFRVQFKKLQRWQLDITSSDGSLFRQIKGEGNPPESIAWDGLNNVNEPLNAAQNYAYSFLAVDEAGNKRIFPGNSFDVPAFSLALGDTLMIGLGQSALFSMDGFRLLPDAHEYASEVATLIRYKDGLRKVHVLVSSAAGERFLQLVADELVVEKSFFTKVPGTQGGQAGVIFYLL